MPSSLTEEELWEVHQRAVRLVREGNKSPGDLVIVVSRKRVDDPSHVVGLWDAGSDGELLFIAPIETNDIRDLMCWDDNILARLRRAMILSDLANS